MKTMNLFERVFKNLNVMVNYSKITITGLPYSRMSRMILIKNLQWVVFCYLLRNDERPIKNF